MFQKHLTIPQNEHLAQMPFEPNDRFDKFTKTQEKNDFDYKKELLKLRGKLEERHQKIMQEKAALKMFNEFKENWMKANVDNPELIPQLEPKKTDGISYEPTKSGTVEGEHSFFPEQRSEQSQVTSEFRTRYRVPEPNFPQNQFSYTPSPLRKPTRVPESKSYFAEISSFSSDDDVIIPSNTTFLISKEPKAFFPEFQQKRNSLFPELDHNGRYMVENRSRGPKMFPFQTYATYPINTVPRLVPTIPDELDTTLNISRYLDHIRALQNEKEIFETVVENLMEYQKQRYGFSSSSLKMSSNQESLKIPSMQGEARKSIHNKSSVNPDQEIGSEYRIIGNEEEEIGVSDGNSLVSGMELVEQSKSRATVVTNRWSMGKNEMKEAPSTLTRKSKISTKSSHRRNSPLKQEPSQRLPEKFEEPERDVKPTEPKPETPKSIHNPSYDHYNNDEGYPFETPKPVYHSLVCNTCHGLIVPEGLKQGLVTVEKTEEQPKKKSKHSCRGCERRQAAECKNLCTKSCRKESKISCKCDKDTHQEMIHHIHNPGSNDSLSDISRYLKYSQSIVPQRSKMTTPVTYTEHDINARLKGGEHDCSESDSIVSYFIRRVNELRDQCHKFREVKSTLHKRR